MSIAVKIAYVSAAFVLLPSITLLTKPKTTWDYSKWFILFMINHLLSEIVITVTALLTIRNLELILLFELISGSLLFGLYISKITSSSIKLWLKTLFPLMLVGTFLIFFFIDRALFIPSYSIAWYRIILLISVILFFFERSSKLDEINIFSDPMFWFSAGFLVYYSVSILYFSLQDYLYHHHMEMQRQAYVIHSFSLIAMNILLTVGICKIRKAQQYT